MMDYAKRFLRTHVLFVAALLLACTAAAQEPTANHERFVESKYDQFDDETTVSLRWEQIVPSAPEFSLRSYENFKGRAPREIPQVLSFFVKHPSSSYSSNVFLIDGDRIDLGPIDEERFHLPIQVAAAIASASRVEARVGGESFTLSAAQEAALGEFISSVVPGGRYDLSDFDPARSGRWSLERTLSYINGSLGRNREFPQEYEHLEFEGRSLTLYSFSERSSNTVAGHGDFKKYSESATDFAPLSAHYGSGVIFLDCRGNRRCVGFQNRHAGDDWQLVDDEPGLQLHLRAGYAEIERVKNALSYAAELVGDSGR